MNNESRNIIKKILDRLLWILPIMSCTQEDQPISIDRNGISATSYVSFSFVSSPSKLTRTNPTGGENGDGFEKGQNNENRITSTVAFFYQGDQGVNESRDTPIEATVVFNSFNPDNGTDGTGNPDRTYTTVPQSINLENGTYHVLVVANPGTDWWTGKKLTIADVRNHIQTAAWTVSGSDYSDFLMTSAADATLVLQSNPKTNPATATVNVERMAARLDYKAEASYTCTDPTYSGATVKITGAALVNNLTAGSYLLKRVADNVNGYNLSYLGDETPDAGVQTNYVLDPWTADKTSTNNNFTIGGEANKTVEDLYGEWFGNISQNPKDWDAYVQEGTSVSDGTETWQRIGYTLENTTDAEEAGKLYSTGVVFKAKFHPQGVANYTGGSTFFALGSYLFASMEDMMNYVYGNEFSKFDEKIGACADWAAVRTFAASLLDNDPSGYKVFLNEQLNGKEESLTLTEEEKAGLKWSAYMLSQCGYSATRSDGKYTVTLDQNDAISTREALKPYGVRTYKDATCYYTWWVRHSNDDDDTKMGIMEYAIVRNNIYKLTVNSIYSLGGDVPGEDENIILDVYVNDWLLLDPETLPM